MDIMAPRVDRQAGPPPQLELRRNVDPHAMICKAIDEHPRATVDELSEILEKWGFPVAGIWIADVLQERSRTADTDHSTGGAANRP